MRSAAIFASALAFAASAFAADPTEGYAVVLSPTKGESVPAGKTFTIKWDAGKYSGPAGISLLAGVDPPHLQIVDEIAPADVEVKDGSYSWAVDCSLGKDLTYGIKIWSKADEGATFQYSFPFQIKGPVCNGGDDTTSTSASASTSTSATVTASVPNPTSYPVETSTTTSSSAVETSTSTSTSTSTISKPTTYPVESTTSTLVTVTTTAAPTTTKAPTHTVSTTTPSFTSSPAPAPTAGAGRVGAGVVFGLAAMVFAL